VLNLIGAGEVVGEIAPLDDHARTADAQAVTDREIMAISRRDFIPMIVSEPAAGAAADRVPVRAAAPHHEQVENIFSSRCQRASPRPCCGSRTIRAAASREVAIIQLEIDHIVGMTRESSNRVLRASAQRSGIGSSAAASWCSTRTRASISRRVSSARSSGQASRKPNCGMHLRACRSPVSDRTTSCALSATRSSVTMKKEHRRCCRRCSGG
jgi:CRP-like cAMP-binding protein